MTKTIELTRGKFALVDDDMFDELARNRWHCSSKGYAVRAVGAWPHRKHLLMHRVILDTPDGMVTDHINGDKLDNRRVNLRACTDAQNKHNTDKRCDNKTGFKGVVWDKERSKFLAQIKFNGRNKYLGRFDTLEEAARAYDEACINLHGEFARPNKEPR